ncbi:hypothetical protein K435DRAFT_844131 [Dendrothele bispora CBS 962.96]|uniref:DUF6534 domain-containing protein n=1 Tax=Dendrothele bispora (strain CBS 962.96) TaxID=1314807 RepID=A0A4S8L3Q8_DENBC|nr:hypothetical protein K435DRAFT_844131 [Dendrothele bispora CBS 962.96]
MDSSTAPPPGNALLIVGPILVGTMLSYMLLGIGITQVYVYYMSFPNDKNLMKISVYGLFFMDILQTIAISSSAWSFLGAGWGRPENLHVTDWGFALIPFFAGVCSAAVQLFFAWRIYVLGVHMSSTKSFWVVICLIVGVSLAQAIAAIVTTIRWYFLNDILKIQRLFGAVTVWLAGSAVADVLITISMTYLINTARVKTRQPHFQGHARHTELLLSRLIRNTVETGAITAGAAVADLIFFLRFSNNGLHLAVAFGLSKLYTNTLYASLNTRASFARNDPKEPGPGAHHSATRSADIGDTFSHSTSGNRFIVSQSHSNPNVIYLNNQNQRPVLNKGHVHSSDRSSDDGQNMIPMVSIVKETFRD